MTKRTEEQSEPALPKGIGKPATRALASVGVSRLDQITKFTEGELLALHGMGPKAIGILKEALRAQGKVLAERKSS